jgi:hypothetical protein
MAAILAVMFSSYREGEVGREGAASVKGSGMWGGVRGVARAAAASAAAEGKTDGEDVAVGLKGDAGRLLVDQVRL